MFITTYVPFFTFEAVFLLLSVSRGEQGSFDFYFLALVCLLLRYSYSENPVFSYMWDCPRERDTNLHIRQQPHDLARTRMCQSFSAFASYTHAESNLILLICMYLMGSEYVLTDGWFSWFWSKSPQRVSEPRFLWRGFSSVYLSLVFWRHFLRVASGNKLFTMAVQLEMSAFWKLGPCVDSLCRLCGMIRNPGYKRSVLTITNCRCSDRPEF